jgi:hypothetical protein
VPLCHCRGRPLGWVGFDRVAAVLNPLVIGPDRDVKSQAVMPVLRLHQKHPARAGRKPPEPRRLHWVQENVARGRPAERNEVPHVLRVPPLESLTRARRLTRGYLAPRYPASSTRMPPLRTPKHSPTSLVTGACSTNTVGANCSISRVVHGLDMLLARTDDDCRGQNPKCQELNNDVSAWASAVRWFKGVQTLDGWATSSACCVLADRFMPEIR